MENSAQPSISVIVPCRNEVRHIQQCVEAIQANSYLNKEIIVVDGMSDDGTREVLANLPGIRVVDNTEQLTPFAFNLGIQHAQGEVICIIGSRMIVDVNYLEMCWNFLQARPEVGCVGGTIVNEYESEESELIARAMASPFGMGIGNFRTLNHDAEVDTVSAPMYRRSIFDQLGMFDEQLVRNQDDEFNFRVTKAGYKIFQIASTSYRYFVRSTKSKLYHQFFQYGYWKVFVNKKHKTVTTFRQMVPAIFVLYLLGAPLFVWVHYYFITLYLLGILAYVTLGIVSGYVALEGKNNRIEGAFSVMSIYCLLHFGYGWGYLRGIVHFMMLNQQPAEKNKSLTR